MPINPGFFNCFKLKFWLKLLFYLSGYKMDYDVIANQPVVIDNGSGVIKAGFAGEQQPKVGNNESKLEIFEF